MAQALPKPTGPKAGIAGKGRSGPKGRNYRGLAARLAELSAMTDGQKMYVGKVDRNKTFNG
jgi:hypothetical protein